MGGSRALPLTEVSDAEVEGRPSQDAQTLAQSFLGKLAKLELEFLGRIDALLNQQSIHGIHRGSETFFARQPLHRLIEADEFLFPRCRLLGPTDLRSRHRIPPKTAFYPVMPCSANRD